MATFFEKYRRSGTGALPKYARLREALRAAIEDGYWAPGAKLPPESELVRITPYSLGTVQRALKALVDEGLVRRRQGRGSFVSEDRRRMSGPWHCRFIDQASGAVLPVFPRVVLKRPEAGPGPWRRLLGGNRDAVAQIDRIFTINDEFRVYGKFFINARRFGALLRQPNRILERSNFKVLLCRQFNQVPGHLRQTARVTVLPPAICRAIGVARGTTGLRLEIVVGTSAERPIYYHELYIPPTDRPLLLPEVTHLPAFDA